MMPAKPLIAITPLWDIDNGHCYMRSSYLEAVEYCGGRPLLIPMTSDTETLDFYLELCDGVILSGGQDVEPEFYGECRTEYCGVSVPQRDTLDSFICRRALETDKVLLGICRGCQMLNAACGGTLYQDLQHDMGISRCHRMSAPYDRDVHPVELIAGQPLAKLLDNRTIMVNSVHHQGIKQLAPGFEVMAFSDDGVVEAICHPGKHLVWGIQWHPEWSCFQSPASAEILKFFIRAAGFC